MKQKWLIFLICLAILGVFYAHAVLAQQKKAGARPVRNSGLLLSLNDTIPNSKSVEQTNKKITVSNGVNLKLYINPVLYSEITDGKLLIQNNSSETIAVYGDTGLIYANSGIEFSFDLPQANNHNITIISAP